MGTFPVELDRALAWLQTTTVATAISENEILFPWIESVHVLAIVLVVGTISIVDLRLLGVASRDRTVSRLMADVLPFTWAARASVACVYTSTWPPCRALKAAVADAKESMIVSWSR